MRVDSEHIRPLLKDWLKRLSDTIDPPVRERTEHGTCFRYDKKTSKQAIILRLARISSGLNSLRLLHENGFLQEQATIQRTLDEFVEDVEFLSWGLLDRNEDTHERFVSEFFQELPTKGEMRNTKSKGRNFPSRDKIRAFLARKSSAVFDQSLAVNTGSAVHQVYSGFVHGYYPQVMDMLTDEGTEFAVEGVINQSLVADSRHDMDNYWFRGVQAFAFAARALGDETVYGEACENRRFLENLMNETWKRPGHH